MLRSGVEKKYLAGLITPSRRCNSGPRNHEKYIAMQCPSWHASASDTKPRKGLLCLSESGDDLLCKSFCATMGIMYYVYLLENSVGEWYVGYTTNLRRRVREHKEKRGGKTTRDKGEQWNLIYYEAYTNKQDALGREKFLKGGSGRKYLNKQLLHYLKN